MRSENSENGLWRDEQGVFGMNSIKMFFGIILVIALFAYVMVIIFGSLGSNTDSFFTETSAQVNNESGWFNSTGYRLSNSTRLGFTNPVIVTIINNTNNATVPTANYTVSTDGLLTNATAAAIGSGMRITYTFDFNTPAENDANNILTNTSTGVGTFFGSVNPVYAILAIMVIILVLVVLVRAVTGGTFAGKREVNPQL